MGYWEPGYEQSSLLVVFLAQSPQTGDWDYSRVETLDNESRVLIHNSM